MKQETLERQNQNTLNQVTPLSKYLSLVLFIAMPFVGGWIGYTYAPAKVVSPNTPIDTKIDDGEASDKNKDGQSNLTTQISSAFEKEQWNNISEDVSDVLQKINHGWLEEIRFLTFSLQGIPGEVIHYCDQGNVIFDRNSNRMCLGENVLVIEWNNTIKVIAEEDTPTQESLFVLDEVFFNEGKFESISESNAETAKLLVVVDELACIDSYSEVCFSDFSLTHVIELPNLQVNQIDISSIGYDTGTPFSGSGSLISSWPNGERFYWNQTGTKAVYKTPCPAGCPEPIFEGFNLNEQTIIPLLSRVDGMYDGIYDGHPDEEEMGWTSDTLFQVGTTTFPF